MIGRVVDGLGNAIDGKDPIATYLTDAIEKIAPGIIEGQSLKQPVQTFFKVIDGMVPIGFVQRGQIIGDRQTGKSAIALDAIINQKGISVNRPRADLRRQ